jgi:hypothetical protein
MPALYKRLKRITARAHAAIAAAPKPSAAAEGGSSPLAREALERFAACRRWMIEQTEAAIAEADAGEFLSDEMGATFLLEMEAQ